MPTKNMEPVWKSIVLLQFDSSFVSYTYYIYTRAKSQKTVDSHALPSRNQCKVMIFFSFLLYFIYICIPKKT